MKNIRLKWRVEKNDILFFLAMAVGVWLFGRILSETSARYSLRIGTEFLGTAFLALGMGLVLIIWLVADFYLSFQLAVGFGQTRTEFLISRHFRRCSSFAGYTDWSNGLLHYFLWNEKGTKLLTVSL